MNTIAALTIGGATQDIFMNYDPSMIKTHSDVGQLYLMLEAGSKIEISGLSYAVGGGAINTAVSFKKMGFEVRPCAKIAHDDAGNQIRKRLKEVVIAEDFLSYSDQVKSGISFILPAPEGNRIILVHRGASTLLTAQDIPEITKEKLVYISSLSGNALHELPLIIKKIKDLASPFIACNPGMAQLQNGAVDLLEGLKNIDLLIVNAIEARTLIAALATQSESLSRLMHSEKFSAQMSVVPDLVKNFAYIEGVSITIMDYFREILRHGPKIAVVTNGSEGVYVAHQERMFYHPSLPIKPISSVGAGDAFGSCFTASIIQGDSFEQATLKGIVNSFSVLQHMDAQQGLLDKQKMDLLLQQQAKYLNKFVYL